MFADLDESIRQLLVQRGNLDSGEVDISFDTPTREWAASLSKPTVNVYFYDLRENTELRNPAAYTTRPGPNNTAIKSRPEVRVDLNYLVTAFANATEDEHRLLTRALITLMQYPVLPEELLQGAIVGQEIRTATAQSNGVIQSLADYWGALDNDIKPSIQYQATLRIDLAQEINVGLALTSRTRVGQWNGSKGIANAEELPLRIGGRVYREQNPDEGISGVKVALLEKGLETMTDAAGHYIFSVPEGQYTLSVSGPDNLEITREILVPQDNYDLKV